MMLMTLVSCIRDTKHEREVDDGFDTSKNYYTTRLTVDYADGFTLNYFDYWKELRLGSENGIPEQKILLLERGAPMPEGYDDWLVVDVPVRRIACQSTTHLAMLAALDARNRVVGFAQLNLIRDAELRSMVDRGEIRELAGGHGFDVEQVIDVGPDVLLTYPFEQKEIDNLSKAGIRQVWQGEYLEKAPLAQTEWIKFMAAFLNKEKEAQEIFDRLENQYFKKVHLMNAVKGKPTVFLQLPYKESWHMAPGNSYISKLLDDAGANYIWKDMKQPGNLTLSFEEVVDRALTADFWLISGDFNGEMNRRMLLDMDERFKQFQAFPEGILVNDLEEADIYSRGVMEPHVVLSDLIHHFHPTVLPDHNPIYFQKLK